MHGDQRRRGGVADFDGGNVKGGPLSGGPPFTHCA